MFFLDDLKILTGPLRDLSCASLSYRVILCSKGHHYKPYTYDVSYKTDLSNFFPTKLFEVKPKTYETFY